MTTVYEYDGWGYLFDCLDDISDLPSFEMLYGGYWFEVLPEDYIVEVSNDGKWCSLCLWILLPAIYLRVLH